MRLLNTILGGALLAALTACANSTYRIDPDGVPLAESMKDGAKVSYRLFPGGDGPPRIHRTARSERQQAEFDVVVTSINAELATRLGLPAWQGVWVERLGNNSSAAKAGLVRGDVILSLNERSIVSHAQFQEILAEVLRPGEPLRTEILRETTPAATAPRQRLLMTIVPDTKTVPETTTDAFTLESSAGVQRLTGMQVASVSAELAREIYGVDEALTIVSGVVTGSPAYLAGFRGGDRVVAVDGVGGATLADVRRAVTARAGGLAAGHDLADLPAVNVSPVDPRDDEITVDVVGPLGVHRAALSVEDDVNESVDFHFPILFDYEADVDSTEWSFLDFIFQFGANYQGRYLSSPTRAPASASELSLFPFGMFEFESRPTYNRYTFLWLITFKTRG